MIIKEIIREMVKDGLTNRQISLKINDKDERYIRKLAAAVRRELAGEAAPDVAIVPGGFHLSAVSTTVNAEGEVTAKHFRAKSGDEGDVLPESGSFPAPDGMYVRSVSTLVDGQTGTVKQQWVKADKLKQDQFEAMIEASRRAAASIEPLPLIASPTVTDGELATLYTITDFHVGMLAWGRETGTPWDLVIAERVLIDMVSRMMISAPPSEVGIINQLGDFLHFDSLKAITPEHGHLLDADSRYQKVVEVAVRVLRKVVEMALQRHEKVYVYMHEGNHDPAGSVWLRVLFASLYENNERVIVEKSPKPYIAFQWGKTMLGFHHGHLSKTDSLPLLFAAMYPDVWGNTTKRYVHSGHLHHHMLKEHPGIKLEQHPTAAGPDAYAARGGWQSERQMTAITYHCESGEFSRQTYVPRE